MKYFLILAAIFSQVFSGMAQQIKVPVGKKYTITTNSNNLVEVTMMDHHTQINNEVVLNMQFELTAVNQNGYSLQITPFHMRTVFSMNGMDQKMDTDSASDRANPEFAKLYEIMDQPQIIEVENNQVIKNSLQSKFNPTGIQDDYRKFFVQISNENLQNGFSWSDSITNASSKIVNQYTLLQITDSTLFLQVNTDYQIQTKVEQSGFTILQNLKGYSNAKRTYWKQNGLLKEESMELDMSGSTETNEMSSPITIKGKSTTILKENR